MRRLSKFFYADTLFAKQKYIIEYTCTIIFTDGKGYVYLHPMQYNSEYEEALDVATRDKGSPKTLISENAGEQIGPHTELW